MTPTQHRIVGSSDYLDAHQRADLLVLVLGTGRDPKPSVQTAAERSADADAGETYVLSVWRFTAPASVSKIGIGERRRRQRGWQTAGCVSLGLRAGGREGGGLEVLEV
ncbi:hypothetical protein VE04_02483 [Pseudogymnoascus sp. 24MN13]|nr:hypothetical protein VE04_02483 [Pseudogymnoascus sp. 24MN13]